MMTPSPYRCFIGLASVALALTAACVPGEELPSSSSSELLFSTPSDPYDPDQDDPTNPYPGTPTPTATPPNAPSGLRQLGLHSDRIRLLWLDNSLDESFFVVQRRRRTSAFWTNLGATTESCLIHGCKTDTAVAVATDYCYRVRAEKRVNGLQLTSAWAQTCSARTRGNCPDICGADAVCSDTCVGDDGGSLTCDDVGECRNEVDIAIEDLAWKPDSFAPDAGYDTAQLVPELASFRWQDTKPKPTEDAEGRPTLWYVQIPIPSLEHVEFLDEMGIHYGAQPLFGIESWEVKGGLVPEWQAPNGLPVLFAIVPGPIYNELRDRLTPDGRHTYEVIRDYRPQELRDDGAFNEDSSLDYQWVVDQNLQWLDHVKVVPMADERHDALPTSASLASLAPGASTANFSLGGLFRFIVETIAKAYQWVADNVQAAFNRIKRTFRGSAQVDVEFVLLNRDPSFVAEEMVSGWQSARDGQTRPIHLAGIDAIFKQGFGLSKKETDSEGRVRLELVPGVKTEICLEMKHDHAIVQGSFLPRRICSEATFEPRGSRNNFVRVEVQHRYANMLAQAIDSRRFVRDEMDKRLRRIHIMTGFIPNLIGRLNNNRAFVPCLRSPNIGAFALERALDVIGSALLGLAVPVPLPVGTILSFLMSADVLMMDDDALISRGVTTHEYGHFATCEFMADAGQFNFSEWWLYFTPATLITGGNDPDFEAGYIHEAMAELFSWFVAGGVNYFHTETGPKEAPRGLRGNVTGMAFCDTSAPDPDLCLESPAAISSTAYQRQIGRITVLLHDLFDEDQYVPGSAGFFARDPNQGDRWRFSLPLSSPATSPDDETSLPKRRFRDLVENYVEAGAHDIHDEYILEEAVFETIGYDSRSCEIYSLMDGRTCTANTPAPAPTSTCSTTFCTPGGNECCPGLRCATFFNASVCTN